MSVFDTDFPFCTSVAIYCDDSKDNLLPRLAKKSQPRQNLWDGYKGCLETVAAWMVCYSSLGVAMKTLVITSPWNNTTDSIRRTSLHPPSCTVYRTTLHTSQNSLNRQTYFADFLFSHYTPWKALLDAFCWQASPAQLSFPAALSEPCGVQTHHSALLMGHVLRAVCPAHLQQEGAREHSASFQNFFPL